MIITVLDFETTGQVEHHPSEPWQIGLVQMDEDHILQDTLCESLLRVGPRPFNPYAPGNHHALREQIAVAPTFNDLWTRLQHQLTGLPLCAHNIGTEKNVLKKQAPLHSFGPWIDTLKLARIAWPQSPSHKLEDLALMLNLEQTAHKFLPDRTSHDALFDALCCALLLQHILRHPAWNNLSLATLTRLTPSTYHRLRKPSQD
jgi:DNA polymerase-3 subunit epsilon